MTIFILFLSHINSKGRMIIGSQNVPHFFHESGSDTEFSGFFKAFRLVCMRDQKKGELSGEDRHDDLPVCRPCDDDSNQNAEDGDDCKSTE